MSIRRKSNTHTSGKAAEVPAQPGARKAVKAYAQSGTQKTAKAHALLKSGEIARARTGITVASDRLDCSPDALSQMKKELSDILSKYMPLDDQIMEIRLELVYKMKRGITDAKTIQIK